MGAQRLGGRATFARTRAAAQLSGHPFRPLQRDAHVGVVGVPGDEPLIDIGGGLADALDALTLATSDITVAESVGNATVTISRQAKVDADG